MIFLKRNSQGFTFIEAFLALSIFSIVLISLYGSFWAGMRIKQRAQESNHLYRSIAWGFQAIERELQQAVFYTLEEVKTFEGSPDEIIFLFPDSDGLKRIRYFLKPQEEMRIHQAALGPRPHTNNSSNSFDQHSSGLYVLCREEKLFLKEDFLFNDHDVEVILSGLTQRGLRIFYAYIEYQEEQPRIVWRDRWDKNFLPASVRINLEFFDSQQPEGFRRMKKTVYIPTGFWGEDEEF